MLYEDQAGRFDERAGVPAEACAAIADVLAEMVALEPGQTWLEIGAGTGALSLALIRHPIRYVGFDRSPAMLAVFRGKLAQEGLHAQLEVADGNGPWPVEDGSVAVIFSARAVHHLDAAHVVAETRRVASLRGVWLVLGRVRRPPDSVKAVMRTQMRRLLAQRGYAGKSHAAHVEALFSALERQGGRHTAPRVAARWTGLHSPLDSLAAWQSKSGLAGLDVPAEVKAGLLDALRDWAEAHYGDLNKKQTQVEFFELDSIFWGHTR